MSFEIGRMIEYRARCLLPVVKISENFDQFGLRMVALFGQVDESIMPANPGKWCRWEINYDLG